MDIVWEELISPLINVLSDEDIRRTTRFSALKKVNLLIKLKRMLTFLYIESVRVFLMETHCLYLIWSATHGGKPSLLKDSLQMDNWWKDNVLKLQSSNLQTSTLKRENIFMTKSSEKWVMSSIKINSSLKFC